jgi:hypothetical protein
VTDSLIALTAVLPDGHRLPLFGQLGRTLAHALANSPYTALSSAAPVLSPQYGPEAHVRVAHNHPLPELDENARDALLAVADGVKPDSRLASTLVLDDTWQGAVVSLSPLHPWKTL